MMFLLFLTASLPYVYGSGSNQLGKAVGIPTLRNTTIFLKILNRKTKAYDRVLVLRSTKSQWMSPGGEIDGWDNGHAKYPDASFEGALVREFLEETGLSRFPKINKNAIYYDYPHWKPHTRVFIAETDDWLTRFHYQQEEANAHTFELISNLTANWANWAKPKVKRKGKQSDYNIRFPETFKLLNSKYSGNTSSLHTFNGASLYTDETGNIVVKKKDQKKGNIPFGFRKGPHWWKQGKKHGKSKKPQGWKHSKSKKPQGWRKLVARLLKWC
jgi:8-oxo-dGTP pyrophosphatase MutT (NUDIX family)